MDLYVHVLPFYQNVNVLIQQLIILKALLQFYDEFRDHVWFHDVLNGHAHGHQLFLFNHAD